MSKAVESNRAKKRAQVEAARGAQLAPKVDGVVDGRDVVVRSRTLGAHSAAHYSGGDTIREADIRTGGVLGWSVDDARNFQRVAPLEPGRLFRSEGAARAWLMRRSTIGGELAVVEMGRALTDEKVAIRANAAGEDVWCGDDASALQIARDACDRSAEWSESARDVATQLARSTWDERASK